MNNDGLSLSTSKRTKHGDPYDFLGNLAFFVALTEEHLYISFYLLPDPGDSRAFYDVSALESLSRDQIKQPGDTNKLAHQENTKDWGNICSLLEGLRSLL